MFYTFIYLANLIIRTLFSLIKHPLAIGLILIMQTTLICISTGFLTKRFWFSYILFLIFLGGILVLFIYVTSLASNEIFNFKRYVTFIILYSLFLGSLIFYFFDKTLILTYFSNNETNSLMNLKTFSLENSIILNKIYNFPINLITILLIIYLFLTLITAVKITNVFEGPLRPKS